MADNTTTTYAAEPEELIENALITLLAAVASVPVEGALNPAAVGDEKRLSADTFIGVKVDQSSQDGDYCGNAPFTYSANIVVHFALADDPNGEAFRDECRAVRSVLRALAGDGCSALNVANAFRCDEVLTDSTSTNFEAGESPTNTKSYTTTIKGRILN